MPPSTTRWLPTGRSTGSPSTGAPGSWPTWSAASTAARPSTAGSARCRARRPSALRRPAIGGRRGPGGRRDGAPGALRTGPALGRPSLGPGSAEGRSPLPRLGIVSRSLGLDDDAALRPMPRTAARRRSSSRATRACGYPSPARNVTDVVSPAPTGSTRPAPGALHRSARRRPLRGRTVTAGRPPRAGWSTSSASPWRRCSVVTRCRSPYAAPGPLSATSRWPTSSRPTGTCSSGTRRDERRALRPDDDPLDPPMVMVTAVHDGTAAAWWVPRQSGMEPGSITVWLSKANHTFRVAILADVFAVHFLTAADPSWPPLSAPRPVTTIDKFTRRSWHPGPGGVPAARRCDPPPGRPQDAIARRRVRPRVPGPGPMESRSAARASRCG